MEEAESLGILNSSETTNAEDTGEGVFAAWVTGFVQGAAQGAANVLNGLTDLAVDYDWSNGLVYDESPAEHAASVRLAELGFTLIGLGVGLGGAEAEATSSKYLEVTIGKSITNIETDVTASEFESNLISSGYKITQQTIGSNGPVTVLSNGVKAYSIYTSTSTGGASALLTSAGEKLIKIRLGI